MTATLKRCLRQIQHLRVARKMPDAASRQCVQQAINRNQFLPHERAVKKLIRDTNEAQRLPTLSTTKEGDESRTIDRRRS